MGYLKLHPKDREKYGAPERIPFDFTTIGVRQRSAVEAAAKRPLRWMYDQLAGVPALDEHNNPIPVPVIDPETGEQQVENGEPVFTPRLTTHGDAFGMLVWMSLWGIGIKVPWDGFDIIESGLEINGGSPDDEGDPGKDDRPETEPTSP